MHSTAATVTITQPLIETFLDPTDLFTQIFRIKDRLDNNDLKLKVKWFGSFVQLNLQKPIDKKLWANLIETIELKCRKKGVKKIYLFSNTRLTLPDFVEIGRDEGAFTKFESFTYVKDLL